MALAAQRAQTGGTDARARLLEIIRQRSLLRGTFKLVSGATSNYYLDMKPTTFHPEGATLIAEIICDMMQGDTDVESSAGSSLVRCRSWLRSVRRASTAARSTASWCARRRKATAPIRRSTATSSPTTPCLIEDVTTKGGSVMQAVNAVRAQGATVKKIITIVDRLEGAEENLKKEGLALAPIFTTKDLLG